MRVKTPLKTHGGKHYPAPTIVGMFPRHRSYVEPYFGGGSVLLARDPDDRSLWWSDATGQSGVCEVANDIDRDLTNFWRVLADPCAFEDFRRRMEGTNFSEPAWSAALERQRAAGWHVVGPDVERACCFFVLARQSLAGRKTCFTGTTKTRTRAGMSNEVSAWISTVDGLPAVHARFRRVLVLDARPGLDVVRSWDDPATLFYLDPPYLHSTRATTGEYGPHEMTPDDHARLLRALLHLRGKFLLSGYRNAMYDQTARTAGWHRRDIDIANHAAAGKKKRRMTECVWCNHPAPGAALCK